MKAFFALFEGEGAIPRQLFHGKGSQGSAAKGFWDWLQDTGWVDDFSSISGVLCHKGIPNPGMIPISKELKAFFSLFEGAGAIPRQHLPRFTSMHNGKGSQRLASAAKAFWDWLKDSKKGG